MTVVELHIPVMNHVLFLSSHNRFERGRVILSPQMRRPYPGDPGSAVSEPGSHHPPPSFPHTPQQHVSLQPPTHTLNLEGCSKQPFLPLSSWECGGMQPSALTREKEMAAHSSILAWELPWAEEPRELQSIGLQRLRD